MKFSDVILGEKYKDKFTGFKGIATCKIEMLDGEPRVGLEHSNALSFDERHFNIDRIEPYVEEEF